MAEPKTKPALDMGEYKYGFHDPENYSFKSGRGLTEEIVKKISDMKGEPGWMTDFRLKSLEHFLSRPMPKWGGSGMLDTIDFDNIYYYVKPSEGQERSWDDVPSDIKKTFDRLGIPEAEKKYLAGVGAQYESEVVYHNLQKQWEDKGVLFLDTGSGLKQHE